MAEQQIHELSQIVAVSGSNFLVISDGTNTLKATVSQLPKDLPVRTTQDPQGVDGSIRVAQYNSDTYFGWDPSRLGRGGVVWKDAAAEWHGILDARDIGRRIYRRLDSATATSYTITAEDVRFGITLMYAGTAAKTITVPGITDGTVPYAALPGAHGEVSVSRGLTIIQTGSGTVTLTSGAGITGLYGTLTTNGDNSRLDLQYDTQSEVRVWRVA